MKGLLSGVHLNIYKKEGARARGVSGLGAGILLEFLPNFKGALLPLRIKFALIVAPKSDAASKGSSAGSLVQRMARI
ncbi:hypothetical protein [Moorena sp. SIOASIH]|uniref:hypothetical protein n=1 Tax=Moorena sp. SIOASIH TaxID=2607817 RepID=UPI0025FA78F7|nr:hypothetical protein [Moorena sp. SIOASIH]